jgi:uncharacterized membrane protein (DUF441 family)
MSDSITALIRTWVPVGVGAFIAWLVTLGVELDANTEAGLITSLTAVAIALYYTLALLLSKKWPVFGVLLGSTKQPTFAKKDLPPTE